MREKNCRPEGSEKRHVHTLSQHHEKAHRAQVDEDGPNLCAGREGARVSERAVVVWAPRVYTRAQRFLLPRARATTACGCLPERVNQTAGRASGAGEEGRVCAAHSNDAMPSTRTRLTTAPTTQVGAMVAGMGEGCRAWRPRGARAVLGGGGGGGGRGGEKSPRGERDALFVDTPALAFLFALWRGQRTASLPPARWERERAHAPIHCAPTPHQWPPPPRRARPRPPLLPSLRRARWACWRAPAWRVRRSEAAALRPGRGCG